MRKECLQGGWPPADNRICSIESSKDTKMNEQHGIHSGDQVKWVYNDITIHLPTSLAFLSSLSPSSEFLPYVEWHCVKSPRDSSKIMMKERCKVCVRARIGRMRCVQFSVDAVWQPFTLCALWNNLLTTLSDWEITPTAQDTRHENQFNIGDHFQFGYIYSSTDLNPPNHSLLTNISLSWFSVFSLKGHKKATLCDL